MRRNDQGNEHLCRLLFSMLLLVWVQTCQHLTMVKRDVSPLNSNITIILLFSIRLLNLTDLTISTLIGALF
jgi:hypothetical protein